MLAVVVACCALAPAAAAAVVRAPDDPGRWVQTGGETDIPLNWYQGVTSNPGGDWFFTGIYTGLYRSSIAPAGAMATGSAGGVATGAEGARNDDVIPPAVTATEGYDHIGDIAWDPAEGGRVLLPLECYWGSVPSAFTGSQDFCRRGGIGVADPQTLQWRYYVHIASLAKMMWAELSPDGRLIWTNPSGDDPAAWDLVAYCASDVRADNAGATLPIAARLPDAVPPSRTTGAAFWGDRLYLAGHDAVAGDTGGSTFRVWSVQVAPGPGQGSRRLELSLKITGESEGIEIRDVAGGDMDGLLHWQVQPYNTSGMPTYRQKSKLLHFRPAPGVTAATGAPATAACGS